MEGQEQLMLVMCSIGGPEAGLRIVINKGHNQSGWL